jgi:hypothetical protein
VRWIFKDLTCTYNSFHPFHTYFLRIIRFIRRKCKKPLEIDQPCLLLINFYGGVNAEILISAALCRRSGDTTCEMYTAPQAIGKFHIKIFNPRRTMLLRPKKNPDVTRRDARAQVNKRLMINSYSPAAPYSRSAVPHPDSGRAEASSASRQSHGKEHDSSAIQKSARYK